jgi:DNA ligase (NAD+)
MSRQDYDAELYTTFAEVEGYSILELEQIIPVLDDLFGLGQDCINPLNDKDVPDNVYDLMRALLAKLHPKSKVFDNVTAAQFQTTNNKIAHDPPMTSISKANGTLDEKDEILKKWLKDCCDELKYDPKKAKDPLFVTSFKHDGVALAIY